tara:strand:- start:239 stop:886 length:648 start_codon:yes stop_codon:yes gene_type:complete
MIKQVLSSYQRSKFDQTPDSIFYKNPRFVHHLDQTFRNRLTSIYLEYIPAQSIILDLMSSWVSHLPDVEYKKVIGHGLNKEELEANNNLDEYWTQDLNLNQEIPLDNDYIDYCLLVAGWQYLQYPEKVSSEILRILKPKGKFIISFSNRAFWNKSPNVWIEASDIERIKYVSSIIEQQGGTIHKTFKEDLFTSNLFGLGRIKSDPFISVIASCSS